MPQSTDISFEFWLMLGGAWLTFLWVLGTFAYVRADKEEKRNIKDQGIQFWILAAWVPAGLLVILLQWVWRIFSWRIEYGFWPPTL